MVTPIRHTQKDDAIFQSDSGKSYVYGREYRALLRSTGHLFRDGRWDGNPDSFHVYRMTHNPGFGSRRTFSAGNYYSLFWHSDSDPIVSQFDWSPCMSMSFVAQDYTGEYKTELPDPVDPDYADNVLELNALGTSYIRRYRPGNPVASLGQFVGELRELPRVPALLKLRTKTFRDIGSDYLNAEFGWVPFVRDLVQLYYVQQTIRDRLNKLIKNNGIQVKRRSKREKTISVSTDEVLLSQAFGSVKDPSIGGNPDWDDVRIHGPVPFGFFDYLIPGSARVTRTVTEEDESWFVGTFFYYVPDIGSDRWTEKAKSVLFGGTTPTPNLIYQLYPWTWLADWFANVGDIVSNLSSNAVDNEVFTDAFVMRQLTKSTRYEASLTWDLFERAQDEFLGPVVIPHGSDSVSYSIIERERMRRQASPFGFGIKSFDFSVKQLALIAALLTSSVRKPALLTYWKGALS